MRVFSTQLLWKSCQPQTLNKIEVRASTSGKAVSSSKIKYDHSSIDRTTVTGKGFTVISSINQQRQSEARVPDGKRLKQSKRLKLPGYHDRNHPLGKGVIRWQTNDCYQKRRSWLL